MKCSKHRGRGRPPKNWVDDPSQCPVCLGQEIPSNGQRPKGPSASETTVEQEAEALIKRVNRALATDTRQTEIQESERPRKNNPTKCPKHQVGRPPKACPECFKLQGQQGQQPPAQPAEKPLRPVQRPAKAQKSAERRGKPAQVKTPAQVRQALALEAAAVLRSIRSMDGAHRCYDCPHAEEDHKDGICLACAGSVVWPGRERHPFRSFLAGANSYFAKLSLAEAEEIAE